MGKSDADQAMQMLFGELSLKHLKGARGSPPAKPQETSVKEEPDPEFDLNRFVGQQAAKDELRKLIELTKVNLERQKRGLKAPSLNWHAVFAGSPGTGKTTFARYYASEIKKLGLLNKGHLVEVARQDLVSGFKGQSAGQTMRVVEKARHGILFIDEAYSLFQGEEDDFGREVVDTLVKVIEDARDELIVILAGYEAPMRDFLHANPGLASRIPNVVLFEDFREEELLLIFDHMVAGASFHASAEARELVRQLLLKERQGRSFGNGRSVRNHFERAVAQQGVRLAKEDLSALSETKLQTLIYSDFTPDPSDHGDQPPAAKGKPELFSDLVGLSSVTTLLSQWFDLLKLTKLRGGEASLYDLNLHMVFMGGPGTGKTTVARRMGQKLLELGLLHSGHVVEVDRSGLVAGYTGQTALKTKEVIDSALAGVLFVDEAYTLLGDEFGDEAVATLLKAMSDYRGRFVVIFAGYEAPMEELLTRNIGLRHRFGEIVRFPDYSDDELVAMLQVKAKGKGMVLADSVEEVVREQLAKARGSGDEFANGRLVEQWLADALKAQATRLVQNELVHDNEALTLLTDQDFRSGLRF